jgi:hypothetical protein
MSEINNCPTCEKLFKFDSIEDSHLRVDLNNPDNFLAEYPIQDDVWPSRLWNKNKTEHVDLGGNIPICEACYVDRIFSKDKNIKGHKVCSVNGCANDSNGISNYCSGCYDNLHKLRK